MAILFDFNNIAQLRNLEQIKSKVIHKDKRITHQNNCPVPKTWYNLYNNYAFALSHLGKYDGTQLKSR